VPFLKLSYPVSSYTSVHTVPQLSQVTSHQTPVPSESNVPLVMFQLPQTGQQEPSSLRYFALDIGFSTFFFFLFILCRPFLSPCRIMAPNARGQNPRRRNYYNMIYRANRLRTCLYICNFRRFSFLLLRSCRPSPSRPTWSGGDVCSASFPRAMRQPFIHQYSVNRFPFLFVIHIPPCPFGRWFVQFRIQGILSRSRPNPYGFPGSGFPHPRS